MIFLKYIMLFILFILANVIGRILSQKYVYRLNELNEFKNFLNIFKTKIRFTCDTIPDIFQDFSEKTKKNISKIFCLANKKMKYETAGQAWEEAIEETKRRREIQQEYNKKHNIIPKTIIKQIHDVISNEVEIKDKKKEKYSKKEKQDLIDRLTQEMKLSASKLDFEKAMELRDAIFELESE